MQLLDLILPSPQGIDKRSYLVVAARLCLVQTEICLNTLLMISPDQDIKRQITATISLVSQAIRNLDGLYD